MQFFITLAAGIVLYQRALKRLATGGLAAYTVYMVYLTIMLPVNALFGSKDREVDPLDLNSKVNVEVASTISASPGLRYGKIRVSGRIDNHSAWALSSVVVTCRVQESYFGRSAVKVATVPVSVPANASGSFETTFENVPQDRNTIVNHFCRFDHADKA